MGMVPVELLCCCRLLPNDNLNWLLPTRQPELAELRRRVVHVDQTVTVMWTELIRRWREREIRNAHGVEQSGFDM